MTASQAGYSQGGKRFSPVLSTGISIECRGDMALIPEAIEMADAKAQGSDPRGKRVK
jgi:hypothetical protein